MDGAYGGGFDANASAGEFDDVEEGDLFVGSVGVGGVQFELEAGCAMEGEFGVGGGDLDRAGHRVVVGEGGGAAVAADAVGGLVGVGRVVDGLCWAGLVGSIGGGVHLVCVGLPSLRSICEGRLLRQWRGRRVLPSLFRVSRWSRR